MKELKEMQGIENPKNERNPNPNKIQRTDKDMLRHLAKVISRIPDLEKFLKLVTDLVAETFGVSKSLLVLHNGKNGEQKVKTATILKEEAISGVKVRTMEAIVTWLTNQEDLLTRQGACEKDWKKLLPKLKEKLEIMDSSVSFPLKTNGGLVGILNLEEKIKNESFTSEDLSLLSTLTEFFSTIINHALFYHTVSKDREYRESILDSIFSGVIAVDSQKKIITFNKEAERILGFKAEQVMEKDVQLIEDNLAELLLETLRTGKGYWRKKFYITPAKITLGMSTSCITNPRGEVLGVVGIFSDLTKIEEEEEIRRQEAHKVLWSKIATSLAHEIKNALSAINTLAQLLPEKYEDEAFRKTFCDLVTSSTSKLDKFADRVNRFAHSRRLELDEVDIHTVVDEALRSVLENRKPKDIIFIRKYASALPKINLDSQEIKRVFTTLLCNGIEAMASGGQMIISTNLKKKGKEDFLEVTFTDDGVGIPEEDKEKIFSPFYTLSKGRASLGLALARRIVEDHGGYIEVESNLGEGSAFSVLLAVKGKETKDEQAEDFNNR
jgi:PAS domain S-box-containing protein